MLSSYLHLNLPRDLFLLDEYVLISKTPLRYSIRIKFPAHLNTLDLITLTILIERHKLWSSSLWSLLRSPFSSLLGPNIIVLYILINNTKEYNYLLFLDRQYSCGYSQTGRFFTVMYFINSFFNNEFEVFLFFVKIISDEMSFFVYYP